MDTPLTSRVTLASSTAYNLYELLTNSTHSGIVSKQSTSEHLPHYCRTVYIENHGGGIFYLATDSGVSTTHHFTARSAGGNWTERMEISNGIDLSLIWIAVSANNTILGVRVDQF